MKDFNKRLDELEKTIKNRADSPFWIEGKNATARVDVGRRRGKEITFPTIYDARCWIETQINKYPGGIVSYTVDNLADLFEDARDLREKLKSFIPEPIVVQQKTGRVIGGVVVPQVFNADDQFPGTLAMVKVMAGMPVSLPLWGLVNLIERYFCDPAFIERWKTSSFDVADSQMTLAAVLIFSRIYPDLDDIHLFAEFARCFFQVTELPAPESMDE